jgi:hypothetical protein
MIYPRLAILVALLGLFSCNRNKNSAELIENLMSEDARLQPLIDSADDYEIQIIYTQIDRDSANNPHFTTFSFNLDSTRYFYPASTVKLPTVLMALEKLRAISIPGLDENTPMFHDSLYSGQIPVREDTTSVNGFPSVAHYSKKILVVSDNDGFNRLYEFLGQKAVNDRMHALGFSSTRIVHRLERPLSRDENRHTEAVRFEENGKEVFSQPMLVNELLPDPPKVFKGKGFIRNDSLIERPFEFTYKNFFPLTSQQELLRRLIFPEAFAHSLNFRITEADRNFVLKYMSQLPTETKSPPYASDTTLHAAWCKFLLYGGEKSAVIPGNVRIFNKIGDAYGYLIDNAYIVDFDNKVEFFLSAVINTNTDQIYNDSKYEYDRLGFPFMKALGEVVYRYEMKRERKYKPDLSLFRMDYDN